MDEPKIKEALAKGIRAARRGRTEPAKRLLTQVVQAEPDNEEAWLWLSRVVDGPAQRTECLQRVLQINPDNRWAAEQLAELQSPTAMPAEKISSPADIQADSDIKLEVLQCPQCGSPLDIQGGSDVKTLVCSYCGSILDLTAEQRAIIGQTATHIRPARPITPGMEGTFEGEVHQVIGWIRYEGWDDEDRWRWDEWLLASARGEFRWLSYDSEEGFVLQKKISPLSPFDPHTAHFIEVTDGKARVIERAQARIIALAGELTWRASVDDRILYLEARNGQNRYSVEVVEDEIELLAGRTLSEREVWTAFGREDLVEKAAQSAVRQSAYKVLATYCVILAVLSALLAIIAGVTGEELIDKQVLVSLGEGGSQIIEPIEIKRAGRVHRVSLRGGGLPVNNWAVIEVTAYDHDNNEFFLFAEEFWDEEGRDSEGYWHESDMRGSHLFKPESAGQYTLELSMSEATVQSIPVTVTVDQGVWLSRYFVISMVLFGILAFVFANLGTGDVVGRSLLEALDD